MQSWGKNQCFVFFNRILRLEDGYYRLEICEWKYSNVPRTFWKNYPSKTGEIWYFPGFSYFLPVPA